MSKIGDIQEAIRDAIAVVGTHYDLSQLGSVQIGHFAGPPVSGAFVAVSPGTVSAVEGADLLRWSYRVSTVIQGWAGTDSHEQSDCIAAAQNLQSDILEALHGAFVDPSTRAEAMRVVHARDCQFSADVLAGDLVVDAWAGWGFVGMEISYTIDGTPGAV